MTRPASEKKCHKSMYNGEKCHRRLGHQHRCLTRYALDNMARQAKLKYIPVLRKK